MMLREDAVIRLCKFGQINLEDPFFDSLKADYPGFEEWFIRKTEESAYIVSDDSDRLQGFLYLKLEMGPVEDVFPVINIHSPIVKVGTFKINAHGTKLGERFVKKIFDFAIFHKVQHLYVTVFPEHEPLISLLSRYGFKDYQNKKTHESGRTELVLIKNFIHLEDHVVLDYPIINARRNKWLLGVYPEYHIGLFPDSRLSNEPPHLILDTSYTNSIHKVFVGQYRDFPSVNVGDIFVVYRTKEKDARSAWFNSVATSVCVVEEIKPKHAFANFEDFLSYTIKHSVFDPDNLQYWYDKSDDIHAIRMTYNVALPKRPTHQMLVEQVGLSPQRYWGFGPLADHEFFRILELGQIYEGIIVN